MTGMNRPSAPGHRRGANAPAAVVLGWLLVLCTLVSCCSVPSGSPSGHHFADVRTEAAARATTPAHPAAPETAVARAPQERGGGSSCHGTSESSAPVVLPGQSAPVALPCPTDAPPAAPLTGAAAIRGPSNDAVREVDRTRLQVQRI